MISTLLASSVAAGFVWSTILFVAALVRRRPQELGFGYALAGAAIYFVTYADRLPGPIDNIRDLVDVLPSADPTFRSSMVALLLLFAVYLLRASVFYRLFLQEDADVDLDGDGEPDEADTFNDYVAPGLSYFCLCICVVALLRGAYDLPWYGTLGVSLLLGFIYLLPIVRVVLDYIADAVTAGVVFATRAWRWLGKLVLRAMLVIANLEMQRRGEVRPSRLHHWVNARLDALEGEKFAARRRERTERRRFVQRAKERRGRNEGTP